MPARVDCERFGRALVDSRVARVPIRFLPFINSRGDLRPRDRRERMVPIGMSKIVAVTLRASAKVGTELPATVLRNRAGEDVLDEIVGQRRWGANART
jgi:hypothetical protein